MPVKVYDRPERRGLPPALLALLLLALLVGGYFVYRAYSARSEPARRTGNAGPVRARAASLREDEDAKLYARLPGVR